ncbi:MAG: septal ring lytic transglycosylase RlpA family protein [Chitinophagaceae bacterium]|nr:septal ring lytic transglycosylase RlpA family protein [Chitinophagaceae bacterium]
MVQIRVLGLICGFLFSFIGSCQAQEASSKNAEKKPLYKQGIASYYADKFQGRRMANGKIYDHNKLTAASNQFSLGTWVEVRNLANKKSVIVQITDRMHPKNKRLIDLSRSAAQKLGFIKRGITKVRVEIVRKPVSPRKP